MEMAVELRNTVIDSKPENVICASSHSGKIE